MTQYQDGQEVKLGDLVESIAPAGLYTTTKAGWQGRIIEIYDTREARVSGTSSHDVRIEYFKLISRAEDIKFPVGQLSISEYKNKVKMGDEIETNGDGNSTFSSAIKGKVIRFNSKDLYIKPETGGEWHVFFSNVVAYVKILKEAEGISDVKKIETKKKKIYITIEKEKNQVYLTLKVPEEIEDYYKSASKGNVKKSGTWFKEDGSPAEFYAITDELVQYERNLDSYSFSDFGTGLLNSGRFNTAILRCVGASDKVIIKSENFNIVSNMELEEYVRRVGLFVKRFWETTISKQKIKSVISYEL